MSARPLATGMMMGKRRAFGLIVFTTISLWILPVSATPDIDRPVAVVELFTSQGCDSCPRADALLEQLAERGDVVALAFHVDYWDYLGWKDTLGRPENSERQREYSRMFGNRSVYTPQIVVNGSIDVKGSKPARVESALRRAQMANSLALDIDLAFADDSLVVRIGAGEAPAEAAIVIVYFEERVDVAILQGKNRGRTHSYVHPVMAYHGAGMWQGKSQELRMPLHDVRKKSNGGVAVIVQEINANGLPGTIRGAAMIHHRPGS
ncbi:DUF1223 domain-containing protein [Mesorhizobium sp. YIM 152430]|uniref:DUF1223 domain-containing protein n=1 Tax=Mesorhizobium sp. YIM 152430 TaxID=3031761 RepID=UPI0023DB6B42|nr:DUF1223 domain-containing protein [Mesorhizobium sp. YIM 152430]MDF1600610.1 DUF1223 domain-containing protein [Mesorhizobium sp. YIM 152430]